MRFEPKTEEQLVKESLLPEGIYDFTIMTGEDKTSKTSGNEMIKLFLQVYSEDGTSFPVNDYLLESMAFKLRHACEACGILDKYESGELSGEDFVGKSGKVKIYIQKPTDSKYSDQNSVKDYVVDKNARKPIVKSEAVDPDLDDSIPF